MTAEGRIRVVDAQDRSVEFDLLARTGDSGELTGAFEFDGTTVVATLVDNEYEIDTVENFGGGAIPEDDPDLRNYLEIGFEFEPDDELVQALVTDEEEEDDGGEEASDDSPGFGILAAFAGLGGVGYAIRRLQGDGRQDRAQIPQSKFSGQIYLRTAGDGTKSHGIVISWPAQCKIRKYETVRRATQTPENPE